jgi:glycosyltransferase involved in cell wall biosynthesis
VFFIDDGFNEIETECMLLSVIIPAWQEARRLHITLAGIEHLRNALPYPIEVILVDDGSTDGTADRALAAGLSVIRQPHKGKGAAVRAGMLAANGMYRMVADADWSMSPEQVLMMLPPAMTGFDVCIASRELPSSIRLGEPRWRHMMGRTYNHLVQQVLLPGFSDTQCGFKVFRAEAARALFSRCSEDGWAFDVEVLALAREYGLRIIEVPIDWTHDPDSRVHPLRDAPGMLKALFRIRKKLAMEPGNAPMTPQPIHSTMFPRP